MSESNFQIQFVQPLGRGQWPEGNKVTHRPNEVHDAHRLAAWPSGPS